LNESVFASIDLGGTNIQCSLGHADGTILRTDSISTEAYRSPEDVLKRMSGLVLRLQEEVGVQATAAGIGVPGQVDFRTGNTKFCPNLPTNWRDVPASRLLEKELGYSVYLLNDVRMATLGELVFGHGQDYPTLVFFALGTGVGGGIVIDGILRLGPLGAAGEIGHLTIDPSGPICGCGNRGCLETLASGPAITAAGVRLLASGLAPRLNEITGGDVSGVSPRTMAQAAREGDTNVQDALLQSAQYLGIAAANMVTSIHPDAIVLGGGVAQIGDFLFETVRQTIHDRVGMFPPDNVVVVPSKLGQNAGTLGGIALAMKSGVLD